MIIKVNGTNQHLIVNGTHFHLKEPEIISLTQLFVNNDFSSKKSNNVPTGYEVTTTVTAAGLEYPASDQIHLEVKYTGRGQGAILYSQNATYSFNSTHYYYLSFYCKTTYSNCRMSFAANYSHSGNSPLYATITDGEWHKYSGIKKPYNTSSKNIFIGCGTSSSGLGEYGEFTKPMLFDLTASFGAGNEPTVAEFENIIGDGFYLQGTYNFIKL